MLVWKVKLLSSLRAWCVDPERTSYSLSFWRIHTGSFLRISYPHSDHGLPRVPFTDSQSRSCAAPFCTLARRQSKRSFCCGETSNQSKRSRKSSQMASMIWIFRSIGSALTPSAVTERRHRRAGRRASFFSTSNAAVHWRTANAPPARERGGIQRRRLRAGGTGSSCQVGNCLAGISQPNAGRIWFLRLGLHYET